MKLFRKKVVYIIVALFTAYGYMAMIAMIFNASDGDILTTAIWNMVFIILFIISDKIVGRFHAWLNRKWDKTKPLSVWKRILNWYIGGSSFKSALYLFYVFIVICLALDVAGVEQNFIHSDFLTAVQYGILLLFAVDKFLERIFKDIIENQECENGGAAVVNNVGAIGGVAENGGGEVIEAAEKERN